MRQAVKPISSLAKEIAESFQGIVQGELHLAQAELRSSTTRARKGTLLLALSLVVLSGGILPFSAFLVLLAARALNENYLAATLLVAAVFFVASMILALWGSFTLRKSGISLPGTRSSLKEEVSRVKLGAGELREATLAGLRKVKKEEPSEKPEKWRESA